MWHISCEHLLFKSRREEWSVRIWRDVSLKQYRADRKAKKRLTAKMLAYINREREVFNQPPLPDKLEPRKTTSELEGMIFADRIASDLEERK